MVQFTSIGWNRMMGGGGQEFLPSQLAGLKLWARLNQGITVTGSGVSQWDDQSGEGNHLKQGTDANRPSKEVDGSILFNGVDNLLKADAFTLIQPESVYILFKAIAWGATDYIFDGGTSNVMVLYQQGTAPSIKMYAGSLANETTNLALGDYGAIGITFDGASSYLQLNNDILDGPEDVGAGDAGGFTLGARGSDTLFSNIQVKEVIVFSTAHDAATRAQVIAYLARVGNLSI